MTESLRGSLRGPMALPRCDHEDSGNSYWGCEAPARFRVERPGDGFVPMEVCPAHVADMMASLLDGDDVPLTVHVHFDEPEAPNPDASPEPPGMSSRGQSAA